MANWKNHLGIALALLLAANVQAVEQFVGGARPAGGVLEMREEAVVFGGEVKLNQVCRWGEGQDEAMGTWGELVIARAGAEGKVSVGLAELKGILKGAGMNLAGVRFAGPVVCVVTRADGAAVPQDVKYEGVKREGATTQAAAAETAPSAVVTLREKLTTDLAARLGLSREVIQIAFNSTDEKLLSLVEPQFRFEIEARRVRNLGNVSWDVTVVTDGSPAQKAVVTGVARAWQEQLVVNRPISGRQLIRGEDVIEKRVLVDSLPDGVLATRDQIVGQQAAMDVKPGAVMTTRLVEAVPLARPGQLVTIVVKQGGVSIRTVAKAVDEGTYGQRIRVKNEGTKEMYDVTLTGPQLAVVGSAG